MTTPKINWIYPVTIVLILGMALCELSCNRADKQRVSEAKKPCPFENGFASLDDLGRATVEALNKGDTLGMWKLSVTEAEFRDIIWPRTPNHSGMPWDHAWQMNLMDADKSIRRVMDDYARRDLHFIGTVLADTVVVVYPEKKTYHNLQVIVEDAEGERQQFRFLNVVQEVDGCFKAVAFHD